MLNIHDVQSEDFQKFIKFKKTPLFIFDLDKIRDNFNKFKNLFPNFKIFYSVKTNPMEDIIRDLHFKGSNFDAATIGEIEILRSQNVSPDKILFTHPIKLPETIKKSRELGVKRYTFDCLEELRELVAYAPKQQYFLRIRPPVDGSFYEYTDKFGASLTIIEDIFNYAINKKIKIHGLSFHVGSQNMSFKPWKTTLNLCKKLINKYYDKIPVFRVINIGGGFPYPYKLLPCPSLKSISVYIHRLIKEFPKDIEFWAEPGRIIVADAGVLVCTIIKNIKREKNRWLYIDMGIYHGLIEILESRGKLNYRIESFKKGKETKYNISGNTLDPDDTVAIDISLPVDLKMGDKLILSDIGAYTTSFLTKYHAMPAPDIVLTKPIA